MVFLLYQCDGELIRLCSRFQQAALRGEGPSGRHRPHPGALRSADGQGKEEEPGEVPGAPQVHPVPGLQLGEGGQAPGRQFNTLKKHHENTRKNTHKNHHKLPVKKLQ